MNSNANIELAKQTIAAARASVAAVTASGRLLTETGSSVRPLYRLYTAYKEELLCAAVADRVIGKAAAAILCAAGASEVYGFVMSRGGRDMLRQYGIPAAYAKLVPYIENRRGDGMCPMEETVDSAADAAECVERIARFIASVPEPK